MSVILYWKERLEAICPFEDVELLKDENHARYTTVNRSNRGWPNMINTNTFYLDFLAWWRDKYVTPLEQNQLYIDNPDNLPEPPPRKTFFTQIKPLLGQVRITTQRVRKPRYYEGAIFQETKFAKFLVLNTWQEHVNAFEKVTGQRIDPTLGESK